MKLDRDSVVEMLMHQARAYVRLLVHTHGLVEYATHTEECAMTIGNAELAKCDCGLDALLKQLEEL